MDPSSNTPERALMTELAAGNVAALGQLFDRCGGALFALAARITGDAERASRVVEQVFAELWEGRASRAGADGGLAPLLARCRALALAARDVAGAASAAPRSQVPLASDGPAAAFAGLPAAVRATLELAYFEGLSVMQIAERTRLDREHVLGELRRGLDALKLLPRPQEWGGRS